MEVYSVLFQRLKDLREYESGRKFGRLSLVCSTYSYLHTLTTSLTTTLTSSHPYIPIHTHPPHITLLVHPLTPSHLTHTTGGHRNLQEEKDKIVAAQIVAIERAQMTARR